MVAPIILRNLPSTASTRTQLRSFQQRLCRPSLLFLPLQYRLLVIFRESGLELIACLAVVPHAARSGTVLCDPRIIPVFVILRRHLRFRCSMLDASSLELLACLTFMPDYVTEYAHAVAASITSADVAGRVGRVELSGCAPGSVTPAEVWVVTER